MKNKIYLVLILLLSFIFIGEVKALDLKSIGIDSTDISGYSAVGYGNFLNNVNFRDSFTITYDFNNLNDKNNVKGYDYLQFGFLIQYNQNETYTETTNDYKPEENGELNCITWELKNQTYADGTTSSYYVCTKWELVNESSLYTTSTNGTFKNTPNIAINIDAIFDNSISTACELNNVNYGNSYVTCKIPNNANVLTKIRFRNTAAVGNTNDWSGRIGMQYYYSIWKDPVTSLKEQQQETNTKLDNIDTSINSSNTSGGESAADDLKNNSAFQDNSGLSSVVSMPLTFVNSLSNTCQPISINIPYFDVDMQIPCFQSIITEKMPALANLIKIVINGFIIYRVLLDIFQIIRNAKNPEDDRIEVLDL